MMTMKALWTPLYSDKARQCIAERLYVEYR